MAIGQGAEPIPAPGEVDRRGVLTANPETFQTSVPKLYVAGDFMTGPSTVIESVAAGRRAAQKIAKNITGKLFHLMAVRIEDAESTDRDRSWDYLSPTEMPTIKSVTERLFTPNKEVELGYSSNEAFEESKRCYLCYLHYEIDINRCILLPLLYRCGPAGFALNW